MLALLALAGTLLAAGAPTPGAAAGPAAPPAGLAGPSRYGAFGLHQTLAQLAALPDLQNCAEQLEGETGRADCTFPADADRFDRLQLAWEEDGASVEVIALRLVFDRAQAPALTDLEWQLTRLWGAPVLEQLRRERDQKIFTLQWEGGEARATLEAQGALTEPSRAVALTLERRPAVPAGELATLRPRPFPGMRVRRLQRIDWDGQVHAVVWGSSLTPAQEAMGPDGSAWETQRSYVGLFRLESGAGGPTPRRRWKPLWERVVGADPDEDAERVLAVDVGDLTGDGASEVVVELSCAACGSTVSEVLVKTVRSGRLADLLAKRDLYRAQVQTATGQVVIREPDGETDEGAVLSTYAWDRSKGAFVLAREERR